MVSGKRTRNTPDVECNASVTDTDKLDTHKDDPVPASTVGWSMDRIVIASLRFRSPNLVLVTMHSL